MIAIIDAIRKAKEIDILTHIHPDGDALGSTAALKMALEKMGKTARVISSQSVPKQMEFASFQLEAYSPQLKGADVVLSVDASDEDRLGECVRIFHEAKVRLVLDHHVTNNRFGDYNYIDDRAAASGEIIYALIRRLGVELDREMAQALYIAISTDTGGLRYSSTSPRTLRVMADLTEQGLDVAEINRALYETRSKESLLAEGMTLETLHMYGDGKIAVMTLTLDTLGKSGAAEEECDWFVNLARSVQGVEVAVLLKQRGAREIKVSLRSNRYVDVAALAQELGGGGHIRAAGCTLYETAESTEKIIVEKLLSYV